MVNRKKFDIEKVRKDFPFFSDPEIRKNRLIYFDNAATVQKPKQVLQALMNYYRTTSNVHRSSHLLSEKVTNNFEKARTTIQRFINAKYREEIIFTTGTTDAINQLAYSLSHLFREKDEVIISLLEHHSNIVPWQVLATKKNLKLRVINWQDGEIDLNSYQNCLNEKTKLVAITHASNVTGEVFPIEMIIDLAHKNNTLVMIDGAQAIVHRKIDVQKLNCDFYLFSGHKLYGPEGIGVLYAKKEILEAIEPAIFGGGMIKTVDFKKTVYANLPFKFEAGTPNIAGAIGLSSAIKYIESLDQISVHKYENSLIEYTQQRLSELKWLKIVGNCEIKKIGIISFFSSKVHVDDLAILLSEQNICVRSGHLCAMPFVQSLALNSLLRLSFAMYNKRSEVDRLILALEKAYKILHR